MPCAINNFCGDLHVVFKIGLADCCNVYTIKKIHIANGVTHNMIQPISSQQLAQILNRQPNDIFLLDVRENNEVEICKLPHAHHIPMNLIPLYLNEIPDDKQIIIYCHHGIRSLNVANYLIANGFDETQIYNLNKGIDDWALTIDNTMVRY